MAFRALLALPAIPDQRRFFVTPDSFEYDQLGWNLAQGRGYSQDVADPFSPDVRRTPTYPALLALLYAGLGHQPALAVGANLLLGALVCLLGARWAASLAGPGVGLLTGLFLATDLTSAVYSLALMAETSFTVLLLLSLLALSRYLARGGAALLLAAVLCGAAILSRPIGVLLPFVLGPALVLLPAASTRRSRVLPALLFTVLTLLAPLGWTLRNYQTAGVAQLTSLVAINAYYHRAAQVEAERRGVSIDDVRQEFLDSAASGGARPGETAGDLDSMERRALDILLSDPLGYLASHLAGVARMLGPDKDLWVQLRAGAPPDSGPARSLTEFVTIQFDGHQDTGGAPRIVAVGQLVVLYVLATIGLLAGLRQPALRAPLGLVLALILYFLVMSGPEAYARFRVPLMPFLALLSALGLVRLWQLAVWGSRTWLPFSGQMSRPD